jgi:shikimate dehydrogenase
MLWHFALMDLGVAVLVVHDRDQSRASALCSDLAKHFGASRSPVARDVEREIAAADGIVNATQVGMRGFPGNPVPVSAIRPTHWAADVIYTPVDTEFIKAGFSKGCARSQRGWHVRAPGGRGVPLFHRDNT